MGIDREYIYMFLTSGNCECTVQNQDTGNSFTYKIKKVKDSKSKYFLHVMTRPYVYTYAGLIIISDSGINYRQGKKGNISFGASSVQVLLYILSSSKQNKLNPKVEVLHLGNCGRCGKPLTDPESLRTGLGPVCRTKF